MNIDNEFIKKSSLFSEFSHAELNGLQTVIETHSYRRGENIFEEESEDEDIYFIYSGVVSVLKSTETSMYQVSELSEGTHFGELSFLDGSPRSTTIQAKTDTELYILRKQVVLNRPDSMVLLNKFYRNIALSNSDRLRDATSSYAQSLETEVALLHEKNYFSRFLIIILTMYSSVLVLTSLLNNLLSSVNVYGQSFTWLYLIMMVVPVLYFVIKSGEPWHRFGVTWRDWKRSLFESLLIGFSFMLVIFGLLVLAGKLGFMSQTSASFGDVLYRMFFSNPISSFIYFLHSYVQEFLVRGVFQNSLQRALSDKKGWVAVIIASIIFGVSHIPYGAALVGVTLVSGFFFGLLFLRHQNLLGVSILHFLLGAFAFSLSQLPFLTKIS